MKATFTIFRNQHVYKPQIKKIEQDFQAAIELVYSYYKKPFNMLFKNVSNSSDIFYRRMVFYLMKTQNYKYVDIVFISQKWYKQTQLHHAISAYTKLIGYVIYAPKSETTQLILEIENRFKQLIK